MSNKYIEYVITSGDTLSMVAQRTLGDATRAMEIALLNNLDYPFIVLPSEDLEGNVKTIGDTLLIPNELHGKDTVEVHIEDDPFGSDLLLTTDKFNLSLGSGGELEVDSYGDLRTVSGLDSLYQDLVHRVITEKGTLPYHPDYGSYVLKIVGSKKDSTWRQKVAIEVSKTFRSDERVVDVTDLQITSIDTGVHISCKIVTKAYSFNLQTDIERGVA